MLSGLVRRMVSAVVVLFMVYAAVTIPIGRRTAYEHLVAIFTTQPAREAARDLEDTGLKLGGRLLNGVRPDRGSNHR